MGKLRIQIRKIRDLSEDRISDINLLYKLNYFKLFLLSNSVSLATEKAETLLEFSVKELGKDYSFY